MLKSLVLGMIFMSVPFIASAEPSAYQQALTCKDECPYTNEFIRTPQVQKVIIETFNNSGIKAPKWLISGSSVTTPVEPLYYKNKRYIKIFACKPHNCNTDNIEGYYSLSNHSFGGTYTEENYEMNIR